MIVEKFDTTTIPNSKTLKTNSVDLNSARTEKFLS